MIDSNYLGRNGGLWLKEPDSYFVADEKRLEKGSEKRLGIDSLDLGELAAVAGVVLGNIVG